MLWGSRRLAASGQGLDPSGWKPPRRAGARGRPGEARGTCSAHTAYGASVTSKARSSSGTWPSAASEPLEGTGQAPLACSAKPPGQAKVLPTVRLLRPGTDQVAGKVRWAGGWVGVGRPSSASRGVWVPRPSGTLVGQRDLGRGGHHGSHIWPPGWKPQPGARSAELGAQGPLWPQQSPVPAVRRAASGQCLSCAQRPEHVNSTVTYFYNKCLSP